MKLFYAALILIVTNFFPLDKITDDMILIEGNENIPSFYLDKREVTMRDFEEFVEATGHVTYCEKSGLGLVFDPFYKLVQDVNWRHDLSGNLIPREKYSQLPVTRLTMEDVESFATWKGKRIPKKSEWIFAAEGGIYSKNHKYIGGDNPRKSCWFDGNSKDQAKPVGTLKPNELGLFDMGGNVSELVSQQDESISEWLGGSFFDDKDFLELENIQNGWKGSVEKFHTPFSGFRCAKDL